MEFMWEVLSDVELHRKAALGYKEVGQSIDLHGREDNQIVREAATSWNAETTDGHPNMRSKRPDQKKLKQIEETLNGKAQREEASNGKALRENDQTGKAPEGWGRAHWVDTMRGCNESTH